MNGLGKEEISLFTLGNEMGNTQCYNDGASDGKRHVSPARQQDM